MNKDNKTLLEDIRGINDTNAVVIPAGTKKQFIIKLWTCLSNTLFPREML